MAKINRGKNEGTIHQRPNGTWRAQVSLQGRRLSFTAKTRRDCQEWLKKTINQIDNGMNYASTKTTLSEFLKGWLTNTKAAKRRNTWDQYQRVIFNQIIPNIGHIKIRDLRPEHIQGMYNLLLEREIENLYRPEDPYSFTWCITAGSKDRYDRT